MDFDNYSGVFKIQHPEKFCIGGQWVKPKGAISLKLVYPVTEKVVGTCPEANIDDIESAVTTNQKALRSIKKQKSSLWTRRHPT